MKANNIRRVILLIIIGILSSMASAETLPKRIDGTGENFIFDTRIGKIFVPDCILEEVHAHWTTWDMDESFYSSGEYDAIFDHMRGAKVSVKPKLVPDQYDIYEYAGLELYVRSIADANITARLRFRPRNQDDYPEYQNVVDLEVVYYMNYGKKNERRALREYALKSYDLWNSVARYTMDHYEPGMLKDVVAMEHHSLQNDPDARAKLSEDAPLCEDKTAIRAVVSLLSNAEIMEHNMAAQDYLHLRFIKADDTAIDVYLQDPNAVRGGHFENTSATETDYVYAQMGANCYRLNKAAIQDALCDAGIPMEMMI